MEKKIGTRRGTAKSRKEREERLGNRIDKKGTMKIRGKVQLEKRGSMTEIK